MDTRSLATDYGAWNPGLDSELPREYLPLATIFRSENVSTSIAKAFELSDYCGLPAHELVAFRPERLIVHELLIHVTTGISVPDGRDYEDLGRNFRGIAATILDRYIAPHRADIARLFEQLRCDAAANIEHALTQAFAEPMPAIKTAKTSWWRRLFAGARSTKLLPPVEAPADRDRRLVSEWQNKSLTANNRLDEACFDALTRI